MLNSVHHDSAAAALVDVLWWGVGLVIRSRTFPASQLRRKGSRIMMGRGLPCVQCDHAHLVCAGAGARARDLSNANLENGCRVCDRDWNEFDADREQRCRVEREREREVVVLLNFNQTPIRERTH